MRRYCGDLRGLCIALVVWGLALHAAATTPLAGASAVNVTARIDRCFELRDSAPAEAIALAHGTLSASTLAADDEIKLLSCLARAAALSGRVDEVIVAADRIDALLLAAPQPPEFALRALSNAGAALHLIGHVPRALDLYRRAFEAAQAGESNLAQVKMLINVASIHSEHLDAYDLAERTFAQAQGIADANDVIDPLLQYNRGLNHLRAGQRDLAVAQFEHALRLVQGQGLSVLERRLQAELVALAGGEDALRRLDALAQAQQDEDAPGAALTRLRMSRLALADGHPDVALAHADAALALGIAGAFGSERREALRARVDALRAAGRLAPALDALEQMRREELDALRRQNLGALADLQARLEDGRNAVELERLRETQRIDALNDRHARTLRDVGAAALLLLVLLASAFAWYQRRISRRLYRLSAIDSLTGLLNRRAAERAMHLLPPSPAPALRHVVFLVDVDHFKHINDLHGHGTGDAMLVEIARRFETACRVDDLVARWGGEEFLLVGTALDLGQACEIAERLRRSITETPVTTAGIEVVLSVSIGFACRSGDATRDAWRDTIALADRALYASKRSGRDAWTGLWFDNAPTAAARQDILRDPAGAISAGQVQSVSSRTPIQWSSATVTGTPERAADPG